MANIRNFNWQAYNKTWTAAIVGLASLAAFQFGIDFTPEVEAGLTALITTFFVFLVPNR